jgi:D-glycero-D-manno-heptose 1,7-bisphosphate phosphatase
MARRAAFLDRDGTIIDDLNYISRPDQVRLRPNVAEAIGLLNENDVAVVVVTNQSGIARGMFTVADYEAVRDRVAQVLEVHGARIDASYYCPHYPTVSGPCGCRKPGRQLFDRAIAELDLAPATSMFAGDRARDVLPARTFGGTAYLIPAPSTPPEEVEESVRAGAMVADTLLDAVRRYLGLFPRSSRAR